MSKHAIIILPDGFEEVEAVVPIDLLRRAGINVTIVGLHSLEVRGSHDIIMKAAMLFDNYSGAFDALILPGGPGHKHLLESQKIMELIKTSFSKNILCAAICAAPSILGKAGILIDKKATCFPGYEGSLQGAHYVAANVVVDGNIITSRGAGTALDFAFEIIAYLAGKPAADSIAKKIIYR